MKVERFVIFAALIVASSVALADGIVSSIVKAPITPDGDVAGAPTDLVINFDTSLDPDFDGRPLPAGLLGACHAPRCISAGPADRGHIYGRLLAGQFAVHHWDIPARLSATPHIAALPRSSAWRGYTVRADARRESEYPRVHGTHRSRGSQYEPGGGTRPEADSPDQWFYESKAPGALSHYRGFRGWARLHRRKRRGQCAHRDEATERRGNERVQ